ncbi:MAG: EamA family transporter [Candidatus Vecturithrix sp.]|jgi:DME family drug/metabolite transporter|nr:EamA family transporter [Candidatus Vecturithrix sp.]
MQASDAKSNGQWFILAASILWGTNGTAQAFAPAGSNPLAIGALRIVIGGIALISLAVLRGSFRRGLSLPFWPTAAAGIGVALYQFCFFAGVAKTGVAVGTIVTIGSSPIFAGILDFLVRKERPGSLWMASTVLAIVGCGLLSLPGGRVNVDIIGIVLALGAGACYGIYAIFNKGLIRSNPPEAVTAMIFCAGAVVVLPVLLKTDPHWLLQPRSLLVVLHLGIITTAGSYTLFAHGLQSVSVAAAVTLTLAEPLTASLLGLAILGERLTLPAFLGIGLIFGALALLSWETRRAQVVSARTGCS